MKDCIYQTDPEWASFLRSNSIKQEVNFWRKDRRRMGLEPGAYFYFKERGSPSVIGRGRLVRSEIRTVEEAWNAYQKGNGASSLEQLKPQIASVLTIDLEKTLGAEIRCMILKDLEWLVNENAYELSEEQFPRNILAMKYFDRGEEFHDLEGLFEERYKVGTDWSTEELRASVDSYLQMLRCHRQGTTFVKVEHYRDLNERFPRRTEEAFEWRARNISYLLSLQGREWLPGLAPAKNGGTGVIKQLEELLAQAEDVSNDRSATFEHLVREARNKRGRENEEAPKGNKSPKKLKGSATGYDRSEPVATWVLDQAKGTCEFCDQAAPFKNSAEQLYLEVHHVKRLADDGPDETTNAVALCPNCHRAFHYSIDRRGRTDKLYKKVRRLKKE